MMARMNRNQALLLIIALLTLPLIWLFVPEEKPGSLSSLEGVTLSTITGDKFKLSGIFTGKKILLVFWSITCGTCIEEIPFMIKLHEKLKDRLTIIGVHPQGFPLSKIQKFVRKIPEKIPYFLAVDEQGILMKTYAVTVLPKVILINAKGEELFSHLGYDPSMESEVEHGITSLL